MSVNKVILVGHLGKDPEMRYTPTGAGVCSFSLATNEFFQDRNGEPQKRTEWHRISVWGKNGENCSKYLKKGKQVYLEGRLHTRSWEDKNGQKHYATEINAHNVQFLGSKPEGHNEGSYNNNRNTSPEQPASASETMLNKSVQNNTDADFTADDVPF